MDTRDIARGLATVRCAIGVGLLAFPALNRLWVGDAARLPGARAISRGLGGRELALGLGTLFALSHGSPVRGWLEASMVADASDFAATAIGFKRLPRLARVSMLATTISAVAAGRWVVSQLDEGGR